MSIVQYESIKELVAQLDIYKQTKVAVYSLQLPSLSIGNILSVTAQFEATNPYSYNVMLGRYLYLCDATHNVNIVMPATTNITPNMHHLTVNIARNYKLTSNFVNPTLSLMAYSAASLASAGAQLKVEQGYGHLDALILGT